MCRLLVICAVFLVSATAAVAGVSRVLPSFYVNPLAADDAADCEGNTDETICSSDCKRVLVCIGGADPIVAETCSDSQSCDVIEGKCVDGDAVCQVQSEDMVCTGRGVFPDPYNCTNYHICKGAGAVSKAEPCCDGWAFDSTRGLCSINPNVQCAPLGQVCSSLGKHEAYPENPNIYYVCVESSEGNLYPALYKCPNGGIYINDQGCDDGYEPSSKTLQQNLMSPEVLSECSSDTSSGTSPGASSGAPSTASTASPSDPSASTPPASTPPASTATTDAPAPGGECSTVREVVPDPANCGRFYQCLATNTWYHGNCIDGFYFDRDILKCQFGTCPYSYW